MSGMRQYDRYRVPGCTRPEKWPLHGETYRRKWLRPYWPFFESQETQYNASRQGYWFGHRQYSALTVLVKRVLPEKKISSRFQPSPNPREPVNQNPYLYI